MRGGFDALDDRQLAKVCLGPVRGCLGDLIALLGISTLTNGNWGIWLLPWALIATKAY